MKIFGVGTDIVKIKRIRKSLKNKLFLRRIFSTDEILRCSRTKNSANCFAKRFSAKEAFSKALGTGISKGINFNEIIILNEKNGKPFIKLISQTKKNVEKKLKGKKFKIALSLSDEKDYAVSFVTISK
ncbi:MAG: holo-ACP synthase [Pseudomonadota bacterium]|nr:holo-ACP synthase [Pseudomonadota bacterium]